ncbi:hypothetical protein DPMN_015084 [Dreissena polymorpha]|uniref:Uncharacterized protein n=1 Tax=Dreissena polymorpha TaxID=45954 RepID=A0A9D4NAK1_DREPO|nr:hypothetical protein DPMN_015084 [Dreissena polymorpha]
MDATYPAGDNTSCIETSEQQWSAPRNASSAAELIAHRYVFLFNGTSGPSNAHNNDTVQGGEVNPVPVPPNEVVLPIQQPQQQITLNFADDSSSDDDADPPAGLQDILNTHMMGLLPDTVAETEVTASPQEERNNPPTPPIKLVEEHPYFPDNETKNAKSEVSREQNHAAATGGGQPLPEMSQTSQAVASLFAISASFHGIVDDADTVIAGTPPSPSFLGLPMTQAAVS